MTEEPRVYTVPEVAEILRVSNRTVWKEIAKGNLRSVKVAGTRRVVAEAIDAYLAEHADGGAA